MNATTTAGDREAAGAVAGMATVYGGVPLPSLGQHVFGTSGGKRFSGEVTFAQPGQVVVEVDDGVTVTVPPSALDDWT